MDREYSWWARAVEAFPSFDVSEVYSVTGTAAEQSSLKSRTCQHGSDVHGATEPNRAVKCKDGRVSLHRDGNKRHTVCPLGSNGALTKAGATRLQSLARNTLTHVKMARMRLIVADSSVLLGQK
jgi:hypothetical protein